MIGWLFGIGWPTLSVLIGRKLYALMREDDGDSFDLEEKAWFGAISLALGALWPLTGLWYLVTVKPPKTARELKKEAEAQRKHIAEMEKELGWNK